QPLYNVLPAEQGCHTGVPPTSNRCLKGKPGYLGGLPDHRSLLDFAQSAADTTRQRFANETKQGWGGEQGPEFGPSLIGKVLWVSEAELSSVSLRLSPACCNTRAWSLLL